MSALSIAVAQSFFNRQPYRVIVDDDIVSLIGHRRLELTITEDQLLNYGIAMFNFYAVLIQLEDVGSTKQVEI